MCGGPLLSTCRKWKPGQPDNWGHSHELGEDCAGLIHEGLWNDFFCEDLISYICEKELETCKSASVSGFVSDTDTWLLLLNLHLSSNFKGSCFCLYSKIIAVKGAQWAAQLHPCSTDWLKGLVDSLDGERKETILKGVQGLQFSLENCVFQGDSSASLPASAIQQDIQMEEKLLKNNQQLIFLYKTCYISVLVQLNTWMFVSLVKSYREV